VLGQRARARASSSSATGPATWRKPPTGLARPCCSCRPTACSTGLSIAPTARIIRPAEKRLRALQTAPRKAGRRAVRHGRPRGSWPAGPHPRRSEHPQLRGTASRTPVALCARNPAHEFLAAARCLPPQRRRSIQCSEKSQALASAPVEREVARAYPQRFIDDYRRVTSPQGETKGG
jgi:hypothetical protein